MINKLLLKLKLSFIPCQENKFRPGFLDGNFLCYSAITLLVLKLIIIPVLVYLPKTAFFADISSAILIELTNKERTALGLAPLRENPKLDEAAALKANDILEKDYFAHQSPQGVSPWDWFKKVGYNYKFAGENLAIGFIDSEEVIQGWLNSPSHKKNLLSPNYSEIGIAAVKGDFEGGQTVAVVQLFGNPIVTKTVATEKPKTTTATTSQAQATSGEQTAGAQVVEQEKEQIALSEQSSSGESLVVVSGVDQNGNQGLGYGLFYFMGSKYYNFLQILIYGFLILVILALLLNVFIRFDIQHPDLILKTAGFIGLLILFVFMDKDMIIQLIPHNFRIY